MYDLSSGEVKDQIEDFTHLKVNFAQWLIPNFLPNPLSLRVEVNRDNRAVLTEEMFG